MCLDVAESDVKAAVQEFITAGYDCFQTSLGGPGVTASVSDVTHISPKQLSSS